VNAVARTLLAGLSGLLLGDEAGAGSPEPARRFIVAFELLGEKGFDFTWPHASLPRYPAPRVLLVVESMPRTRKDPGGDASELPASRFLRINGRLHRPLRGAPARGEAEEFLVPMQAGRLRLSFTPPAATRIDPGRARAVIRLYDAQAELEGGRR